MTDVDRLETLTGDQCRWLLGQECVGRVAVTVAALPAVFPVNYAVAADEILFFTGAGTKLQAATANAVVAFEVDHVDRFSQGGWSVQVVGVAREVTEPVVVVGARASGLRPWADGDRWHLVGLRIDRVSGRRIAADVDLREPAKTPDLGMVGPRSPVSALAHPPVRIGSDWSLQEAAHAMRAADVSSVLVAPDTAIVTERDLTRALNAGLGPDASVTAVSVTDLVSVDEDTTVLEAAGEMLRHEISHLLVCNHRGAVVGMVGLRQLLGVLVDAMDPAVWVMLRETLSLRSGTRLG